MRASAQGMRPAALAPIALFGALIAALYFKAFHWLVTMDWTREDYSSSALVPLIVLYLLWGKRRELASVPSVPAWKGLIPVAVGLLLFWVGELSGEFFSLYLSFWFVLTGLLWIYLGWDKLKVASFPLAFLLATFPPPHFINGKMSFELKLLSSRLGVWMLQVCGMSAFREGNVIDLGFTRLQVVDACSGIRYLVPLIVMGILLAYYYKAPLWKKVLLVATTIPLSVVTNGFRIASVGLLYPIWGKEAAEGFFHDFSGWLIFMITLGMLLLEMWALRRIFPERAPAPPEPVPKAFVPAQAVKIAPPQAVVAFLLLGATLAVAQGVNFREKVPSSLDFGQFPLQVGGWQGVRSVMPLEYVEALKFTDYAVVDYRDSRGETVNFYVAWYDSQSKGRSIHSPETCLPGGGWTFEESGLATVPLAGTPGGAIRVSRAFMIKDGTRMLTYYWFPQRGRMLTNPAQLKYFAMWDALTRHRTDGALVRLITVVPQNEKLADAEARLQQFTRELVPVLSNYIPE